MTIQIYITYVKPKRKIDEGEDLPTMVGVGSQGQHPLVGWWDKEIDNRAKA